MKLVRFLYENEMKCGILEENAIIEVDNFYSLEKVNGERSFSLKDVKLLAPVEPGQAIAIGLNYLDHAKEQGKTLPEEPMMFMVSTSAITGPGESITLQNSTHRIDFEAELVIVIGKKAERVKAADASDYILGYTIGNDVSDRDYQKKDGQFTRAKSFYSYKPVGPWIETELASEKLSIQLHQNSEIKQDGNTGEMIHSINTIIETVTDVMTLMPGDVIFTGTPAGVGALKKGDQIEITIEGIGTLRNDVIK